MKFLRKRKHSTYRTFGIAGASRGCGVTSLCLLIANYLASVKGKKVIYVELTTKSKLEDMINSKFIGKNNVLRYKKVDFVTAASVTEAKEILTSEKSYIIVDFFELNKNTMDVYNMCERQIVLGACMPWKQKEYVEFIRRVVLKSMNYKKILLLGVGVKKEKMKTSRDIFEYDIQDIKYIGDPYCIKEKDFPLIDKIISK